MRTSTAIYMVFAATLVAASGCVTVRLHAGPTMDTDGNPGVRGGFTVGMPVQTGDTSAAVFVASMEGGASDIDEELAGLLDLRLGVDMAVMPERTGVGYRLGMRLGHMPVFTEDGRGFAVIALRTAVLSVLRARANSDVPDQFHSWSPFDFQLRSWMSLGAEVELSLLHDLQNEKPLGMGYIGIVWEILNMEE